MGVLAAGTFNDTAGHWAEVQIKIMTDDGIISGYPDGAFKPDGKITRAEFASLIVKGFNLTKSEGKSFIDTTDHWAKEVIATANAAGIVSGYSNTAFGPDDPITREQMTVMIVKAAQLSAGVSGKTFADSDSISEWAREAVNIATSNKIINGYLDNTFRPKGNTTRAEAVVALSQSLSPKTPDTEQPAPTEEDYSLIDKVGTYGPKTGSETVSGDVTVKAKDTILQNLIIKGDLIIAEEVGDGDVTLNNIIVEGITYIRGGGIDSIHINGGEYREIIIERTSTGAVRIVAIDLQGLPITVAEDDNGEEIILSGDIESVTIKADNVTITTQGETTIGELKVASGLDDVNIELTEDTTVKELVLNSKVEVTGEGEINKASGSKASNSTYENQPDRIVGTTPGGKKTTSASAVTGVTISPKTATVEKGTTQQFTAKVTGTGSFNKTVTWTVSDTVYANTTIDTTGKLAIDIDETATELIVTATANGDSSKKDTATVTVTVEKTLQEQVESAIDYSYDPAYEYNGELESDSPYWVWSYAEINVNQALNDIDRYLGALYWQDGSTIDSIRYEGVDYLWNDTGTREGSNWENNETNLISELSLDITEEWPRSLNSLTLNDGDTGYNLNFNLVVSVPVTGVTLNQETLTLTAGGATGTITATVSPANATNKTVTWTSSNETVATVADGVVASLVAGTTTITATTLDGSYTATTTVTVATPVPEDMLDFSVGSVGYYDYEGATKGEGQVSFTFANKNAFEELYDYGLGYDGKEFTHTNGEGEATTDISTWTYSLVPFDVTEDIGTVETITVFSDSGLSDQIGDVTYFDLTASHGVYRISAIRIAEKVDGIWRYLGNDTVYVLITLDDESKYTVKVEVAVTGVNEGGGLAS